MKVNFLFYTFLLSTFLGIQTNKSTNKKKYIMSTTANKNTTENINDIASPFDDLVCINGVMVPRVFQEFNSLSPVLVSDFINFIINTYAIEDQKDILKKIVYTTKPEQMQCILENPCYFKEEFLCIMEKVYPNKLFSEIYQGRLVIEYFIYSINLDATGDFPYTFLRNITLKNALQKIINFVDVQKEVFLNVISEKTINEFKKFLSDSISGNISHLTFLQSLNQKFGGFIEKFTPKTVKIPSSMDKAKMFLRFRKIFSSNA